MDNNFFNSIEHNAKTYSKDQISIMNMSYPWTHSIRFQDNRMTSSISQKEKNQSYKLYPTGYCDVSNGREYVALPSDLKITSEVKEKYNLL